ncbi:MAG: type II toxin-antitoxin system Phd/YefM family antitoxin [Caldilineaceae bacterium]
MPQTWHLKEAKNQLSNLIDAAIEHGPQIITRRGHEVAVVLSCDEYGKLMVAKSSLSDFFRRSPLTGEDISLERDKSEIRDGFI